MSSILTTNDRLKFGALIGISLVIVLFVVGLSAFFVYSLIAGLNENKQSNSASQNGAPEAGDYDSTPNLNWGRLLGRSFSPQHQRYLIRANYLMSEGDRLLKANPSKESEAITKFQEALPVYEQQLGKEDYMYQSCLSSIANCQMQMQNFEEAALCYEQLLSCNSKKRLNRYTAGWTLQLAKAKMELDDLESARKICEKCLQEQEKILGKDNARLIASLHQLADIYEREDAEKAAESSLQRALSISKKPGAANQDWLRQSNSKLADFYFANSKFNEASSYYKNIEELSKDDPDWRIYALEQVASCSLEQSKWQELKELSSKALKLRKEYGKENSLYGHLNDLVLLSIAELACSTDKSDGSKSHQVGDGSDKAKEAFALALERLKSASNLEYTSAERLSYLCKYFLSLGKPEFAIELLSALMNQRGQQNSFFKSRIGLCYLYLGKEDQCKDYLLKNKLKADLMYFEFLQGNKARAQELLNELARGLEQAQREQGLQNSEQAPKAKPASPLNSYIFVPRAYYYICKPEKSGQAASCEQTMKQKGQKIEQKRLQETILTYFTGFQAVKLGELEEMLNPGKKAAKLKSKQSN